MQLLPWFILLPAEQQHWAAGRAMAAWQSHFVQHGALRDVPSAGQWLGGIFLLLSAKEQMAFKHTNVPLKTVLIRAQLWIPWLLWLRSVTTGLGPGAGVNVSVRHLRVLKTCFFLHLFQPLEIYWSDTARSTSFHAFFSSLVHWLKCEFYHLEWVFLAFVTPFKNL